MPTIKRINVTFHGLDSPSYFPGHGIALTSYTDCATGVGESDYAAIQDALEQLCQREIDMDAPEVRDMLDRELRAMAGRDLETFEELARYNDAHEFCEHAEDDTEDCEMAFYVSIDLEVIP